MTQALYVGAFVTCCVTAMHQQFNPGVMRLRHYSGKREMQSGGSIVRLRCTAVSFLSFRVGVVEGRYINGAPPSNLAPVEVRVHGVVVKRLT